MRGYTSCTVQVFYNNVRELDCENLYSPYMVLEKRAGWKEVGREGRVGRKKGGEPEINESKPGVGVMTLLYPIPPGHMRLSPPTACN